MLSSVDRQQKFEQLRAHWEAVESSEDATMVDRRGQQAQHQAINAGSKFRRKLSHGLALISLTQRKAVHGQQLSSDTSLTTSAPSTDDSSTFALEQNALLSPVAPNAPLDTTNGPAASNSTRASEEIQTPTQLPRSRTFSYIPRPVKVDSEVSPPVEPDKPIQSSLDTVMADPNLHAPSRIPTPSPPQSKRRGSSPRQYLPHNVPLQPKFAVDRRPLAGAVVGSPLKAAMRSRTTPNLLKATNTGQPAGYMAPRRPGLKRPSASSTLQKPVLAENVPTNKRVSQRLSQIQDKAVKKESLSVPSATANRRSFGPVAVFSQSKRASFTTPSIATKRLSSYLSSTPATIRSVTPHQTELTPIANTRDQIPKGSPTPTLSTDDPEELLLAPPPLNTDADTPRRTLGTPNGLGGVWRSSRVFAAANHQVRRLPRSSTFHHFGRRQEDIPPVPPIPDQYNTPSSKFVSSVPSQYKLPSRSDLHRRIPVSTGKFGMSSRSLLSEIASVQKASETASLKSTSTAVSVTAFDLKKDAEDEQCTGTDTESETCSQGEVDGTLEHRSYDHALRLTELNTQSSGSVILPTIRVKLRPRAIRTLGSETRSKVLEGDLAVQRHWSISDYFYPDSANDASLVQVKDYMPPLYWAGRFQSRFDQWRTEAMVATLHPGYRPETEGPLGQCGVDDEEKATILIFMQLRDLCASAQAADSLHEFEYRYRKDHKMLDTKHDLPPSLRKPEESTPKGPIGRAVRKLTPRKASFANLFKGKGWNRNDDTKSTDVPEHIRELREKAGWATGFDTISTDEL